MDYELRVIVEKVAVSFQQVVKRDTLKVYDIKSPQSILDLGLRHAEQISLLEKIQNALLAEQSALIEPSHTTCPKCGQKLSKFGFQQSNFHAVFSDHKLRIQKHRCSDPECDWQSAPTTLSVFGTATHPDLVKLQCEQGALYSFREAETNLQKLMVQRRRTNNHNQIKLVTNKVGEVITQENLQAPDPEDCAPTAQELTVQVDGGHIPIKEKDKRSFEALSAVVYRPENIREVDKHHREITDKNCVVSAQEDNLATIKTYVQNAALKQGMTAETKVTALADGASNCWSVIASLAPHCQQVEGILDWFHIGMKFQNAWNALRDKEREALDRAKWSLWHGDSEEAIHKLTALREQVKETEKEGKVKKLQDYLQRNQDYLVNYKEREEAGKTFTSQVAETHVDSIINTRHKRSKKMQWTREGAHNVLQIRGLIASREWDERWQGAVLSALGVAA